MDRIKAQYTEGIVSIICNSVLFAFKMWAGIKTGSIALTADAWHTLSDSISSLVIIAAVLLTAKKADKEHPFGHGRWEHISSLFVAVILGIVAYDFLEKSIIKFTERESTAYGTAAVIVTAASIVVKEALAQYAFYIGRKSKNSLVRADAWHHRSDALSSLVVLAGIFMAGKFWWIDSVLGMIVALMLFYATFKILKEAITKLLGEEPGEELTQKLQSTVKGIYKDDLNIHHIHIHNYVIHNELTLHIRLKKSMTIEEGHKIATIIEDAIKKEFDMAATIHVEPM